MSSLNEKGSFEPLVNVPPVDPSAARLQPNSRTNVLSTIESIDSGVSPSPTAASSPVSEIHHPFYSQDTQVSESKQNIHTTSTTNTDLEAGITLQKSQGSELMTFTNTKECTVWPGQRALKQKEKEMKIARRQNGMCGCMAGYSKRTRMIIKVLIALLVIGAAVGVGVGISKAVGGSTWKNN